MKTDLEYDDFNIYDINSIISFIKENTIQILLLLLVPVIIYIVDHISNINTVLFGLPSAVPSVTQAHTQKQVHQQIHSKKRKGFKK
jgi:hypothetical protein